MDKKLTAAVILLVLVLVLTGAFFWSKNKQLKPLSEPPKQEVSLTKTENIPAAVAKPLILQSSEVIWYESAREVQFPGLFNFDPEENIKWRTWEVGELKDNGEKIIFMALDPNDPGGVRSYVFMTSTDRDSQRLQPYARYSSDNILEAYSKEVFNTDKMLVADFGYNRLPSLEYPGYINFGNTTIKYQKDLVLELENPFFTPETTASYEKKYFDNVYGDIFVNNEDGGLYLKSPLGIAKVYSVVFDFFEKDVPQVTWNDGSQNTSPFTHRGVSGCGFNKYADVVTGEVARQDLVPTGKTSTNQTVYEFKDKNNTYLKKWYEENKEFINNLNDDENMPFKKDTSFEQFASNHLVFFLEDSLGRLVRFVNYNFVFTGGCGKPVIYLYPEKTTEVSVKVTPTGGMTVSDPAYNGGWKVVADPNSNITNLADGKTYPYLFWEGRGDSLYRLPKKGFVVAKENLDSMLSEKLTALGLTKKEIDDFKEFWLPRMLSENKPFYFVTFLPQREIDKIAPLSITPTPDTIIRVLMDYQGLDEKIDVPGFEIKKPLRKGFTVLEWGGVLN